MTAVNQLLITVKSGLKTADPKDHHAIGHEAKEKMAVLRALALCQLMHEDAVLVVKKRGFAQSESHQLVDLWGRQEAILALARSVFSGHVQLREEKIGHLLNDVKEVLVAQFAFLAADGKAQSWLDRFNYCLEGLKDPAFHHFYAKVAALDFD